MFSPTTVGGRGAPTNPTTVTAPPGNTDRSPPIPSGPQGSSMDNATTKLDGKVPDLCNILKIDNKPKRRNVDINDL